MIVHNYCRLLLSGILALGMGEVGIVNHYFEEWGMIDIPTGGRAYFRTNQVREGGLSSVKKGDCVEFETSLRSNAVLRMKMGNNTGGCHPDPSTQYHIPAQNLPDDKINTASTGLKTKRETKKNSPVDDTSNNVVTTPSSGNAETTMNHKDKLGLLETLIGT